MRRWLLAGGVALACASAASTQSMPQSDDALSPAEILSKPLAPETGANPDAGTKSEPSAKSDAGTKPEPSAKSDAGTKSGPSAKSDAGTKPGPSAKSDAPKSSAKKPDAAAPKPATPKATAAKHDPEGLEQCLRTWDAATHMTRGDWARVCRAIVAERARRTAAEQRAP